MPTLGWGRCRCPEQAVALLCWTPEVVVGLESKSRPGRSPLDRADHRQRWPHARATPQVKSPTLISDGNVFQIDLNTLSLDTAMYDKVRRLCNSSDPKVNPFFPCQWQVYWKEQATWNAYEQTLSRKLNMSFEQEYSGTLNFTSGGYTFIMDLQRLTALNTETQSVHEVRRRPIFRSYQSMLPHIKTESKADVPQGPLTNPSQYPSTWVMDPLANNHAYIHVPLNRTETAFDKIVTHFHLSVSKDLAMVCDIYRIQNKFLWQKYKCQKEFMSQGRTEDEKLSLERNLYHGTSGKKVNLISRMNFDPRISGIHGASYGDGSYFALDAGYSHKYTNQSTWGYRHMFLAKVLVGRTAPGKPWYRRPPVLSTDGTLYDSCVDKVLNPKIFVIFDSCQCYPFFMIRYKLLSEPVHVCE